MTLPVRVRRSLWFVLTILAFAATVPAAHGAEPAKDAVPAVMLSDLHFDPFHDPAKVPQLVKAPVEAWEAILNAPDSATQSADFEAVQSACHSRGVDSPYELLKSALLGAKAQATGVRFVTVTGDLIVHDFDCRYRAALHLPKAVGDDQSVSAGFAEKATVFVMRQVESAFVGKPVYPALGNNDSRCNHNRLDVHDLYLKATAQTVIDGLVEVSPAERALALTTYEAAGYYAVTMPAPMHSTRLLVLDDIYMMTQYANCEADSADRKGAQEQLAWLAKELDAAHKKGQRVWVMGHVPPTVNPLRSLTHQKALCAGGKADAFLTSDDLETLLTSHADTVALGLFGHTHMDELHLVGSGKSIVALKVVASVSPVDGNRPSFTVAKVAPDSATLLDYTVYEASNSTGDGTLWGKEYSFGDTYDESSFSAASLEDLVGRLHADTAGSSAESQAYQKHFFTGGGLPTLGLGVYWSGYTCSLDHSDAEGFKACVCSPASQPAPK